MFKFPVKKIEIEPLKLSQKLYENYKAIFSKEVTKLYISASKA